MAGALKVAGNHLRIHVRPTSAAARYRRTCTRTRPARRRGARRRRAGALDRGPARAPQASSSSTDGLPGRRPRAARRNDPRAGAGSVDNVGAYVRAPEPACLYRMHGTVTGAYRIPAVRIDNRLVTTNKLPDRAQPRYGGQDILSRSNGWSRASRSDSAGRPRRDPPHLLRADEFPYHAAAGSIYDAGDYARDSTRRCVLAGYDALVRAPEAERGKESTSDRIGCIVEPPSTWLRVDRAARETRDAGLPKSGCTEAATVAMDPLAASPCGSARRPKARAIKRSGADRRAGARRRLRRRSR